VHDPAKKGLAERLDGRESPHTSASDSAVENNVQALSKKRLSCAVRSAHDFSNPNSASASSMNPTALEAPRRFDVSSLQRDN